MAASMIGFVSIHASVKDATQATAYVVYRTKFQSTHL